MPLNIVFLRPQNWSLLKNPITKALLLPSRAFPPEPRGPGNAFRDFFRTSGRKAQMTPVILGIRQKGRVQKGLEETWT